ncbi:hypothetical protein Acsp06_43920 [Actinomycetospora sp. NBRC 106375]|uniref:hypothetical protein n=1 Tax=Actinomycetospora sp. NBRC 106375 TaxID=3032207 RepID=UPI0024A26C2E|nr:hypothetical protein [Actinomycetospora sp. NBRC 106375]GLZ48207.1 hypothetical protein Acsp06_43920 [Actinomycetospora sp. NBRC 106375]
MEENYDARQARELAERARSTRSYDHQDKAYENAVRSYERLYRREPGLYWSDYWQVLTDGSWCLRRQARLELAAAWSREAEAVLARRDAYEWKRGDRSGLPDRRDVLLELAKQAKYENNASEAARILSHGIERQEPDVVHELTDYCLRRAGPATKKHWLARAIEIGGPQCVADLAYALAREKPSSLGLTGLADLLERAAVLPGSESPSGPIYQFAEVLTRQDEGGDRLSRLVSRVVEIGRVELADQVAKLIAGRIETLRAASLLEQMSASADPEVSSVGLRHLSRISVEFQDDTAKATSILTRALCEDRADVVKSTVSDLLSTGKIAIVTECLDAALGRGGGGIAWRGYLDVAYFLAIEGDPESAREIYQRIIESGDEKSAKRAAGNLKFLRSVET